MINYFAYGSNLSRRRLESRLRFVSFLCLGRLLAHRLLFHKKSQDGSAKCDAQPTNDTDDVVFGVIYEIDEAEKPILDRIEERGYGYQEKTVNVHTAEGTTLDAMVYVALHIDASLKPYHWYKEHVLIGAREHHLPSAYILAIERVESMDDPMPERQTCELQIYR